MHIKLSGNIIITSDAYNIIVKRTGVVMTGKNKGEPTETTLGFYTTVQQALSAVLRLKILESEAQTLNVLLLEVKAFRKEIDRVLSLEESPMEQCTS